MEFLIDCGVNLRDDKNLNHHHQLPIHWACEHGHTAIVELLIKQGASLKETDSNGRIALHLACLMGHVAVVKLLTEINPETNKDEDGKCYFYCHDEDGRTPFHLACNGRHVEVLKLLHQLGKGRINFKEKDSRGNTPLHLAVKR